MHQLIKLTLLPLLFFVGSAVAERASYVVFETDSLNIKLSNDGTGIVKDVGCYRCDFKIANITRNSKVTVNNVEVNILEAQSRGGKPAMVSINPKTREVYFIRWSE